MIDISLVNANLLISDSSSFKLQIYIPLWFPNTQAKCKQLFKLIIEYAADGQQIRHAFDCIHRLLMADPRFKQRANYEKPTFQRMLKGNLKLIREFNGLYGGEYRYDA